ncbi:MAG: hypothetical protein ABI890_12300 [Lapillicoccus sp.]
MTNDDLSALQDATQVLLDLVRRLDAHHNGEDSLSDTDLEQLLRESGTAKDAWQEAFRQSVITARTPPREGVETSSPPR